MLESQQIQETENRKYEAASSVEGRVRFSLAECLHPANVIRTTLTLCWKLRGLPPQALLRESPLAQVLKQQVQRARYPPMQPRLREEPRRLHLRRAWRRHSRPCTNRRP